MEDLLTEEEEEIRRYLFQHLRGEEFQEEEIAFIANLFRQYVVEMVYRANSGHMAGALGMAEVFATLYTRVLRIYPEDPLSEGRDRFLLSNGHICALRYVAMAFRGIIPIEELFTFRKLGSRLQGHPSTKFLREVENSSGSLGQGLSQACGVALALRLKKNPSQVVVSLSDGELQEGSTWEAFMSASHYKLENLLAFIDKNNIQIDGYVEEVMDIGDLKAKIKAFGWEVREEDGHNIPKIIEAFSWGYKREGKPKAIIFHTVAGKGVSWMENNPSWHGKPPSKELRDEAIKELKEQNLPLRKRLYHKYISSREVALEA